MKRSGMGDAARRLVNGGSVLDELTAHPGEAPATQPEAVSAPGASAPVEAPPKRKARAKVEEVTEKPPKQETYGVQFFPAQWEALEAEADRRKKATGSRRRDVSAVLREVVDRWIEEGGE